MVAGFIVAGLLRANPMAVAVGLFGDLFLSYDTQGTEQMATPLALLIYSPVSSLLIALYFALLESGGRKTLGKKFLKLEVSKTDGYFISIKEALVRNLSKILAALIGGYLLGFLGIVLLTAVALNIEFFFFREKKEDFRQRYLDQPPHTIILLEEDETKPGVIALPRSQKKVQKPKVKRRTFKKREKELPEEKKVEALPPTEEKKEEEEKEEEPEASKPALEKPEEEEGEKEEKVSFWKKLFGGAKKEEEEEFEVEDEEEVRTLPAAEKSEEQKELDEISLEFMMEFDINEERARSLVDTGYRSVSEFRDAIPRDLMMIKGINPTLAKRIIEKANE